MRGPAAGPETLKGRSPEVADITGPCPACRDFVYYCMNGPIFHISRHSGQTTPRAGRPYIVSLYEHQEFF